MPKKTNLRKVIFFIIIILSVLLSIEIILRVIGAIYLQTMFMDTRNEYARDNTTIILALGESSTAGLFVQWNESYPAQLEKALREKYPEKNIRIVVPLHMGQNTGQLAKRINQYINVYKPKLIIVMAGYNNEWSLAESNIGKYIQGKDSLKIKIMTMIDNLRTYRVIRYVVLRFIVQEKSECVESLKNNQYMFGGPEYVRFPPKHGVYAFAIEHKEEFREVWRNDIENIIRAAKKNNISIILMTYHINPTYLPAEEFVSIAARKNITLVRNDLTFQKLLTTGQIPKYVLPIDHWHPNQKGYELIAKNVFNRIVEENLI